MKKKATFFGQSISMKLLIEEQRQGKLLQLKQPPQEKKNIDCSHSRVYSRNRLGWSCYLSCCQYCKIMVLIPLSTWMNCKQCILILVNFPNWTFFSFSPHWLPQWTRLKDISLSSLSWLNFFVNSINRISFILEILSFPTFSLLKFFSNSLTARSHEIPD